ncbi:MAG: tRNA (adenosine(37)-N6)-threonylcarbamoyltransferase complex dimerization subunit type 1 TsaB [Chitinophagales bacterium]|nr:tRNA (adenosine(37)-N6)-threonylcarbamoyltransferase complex dimerization subunit type 1 TsaB [Bacteroidota bacterium]MBX7142603.1 tRNA (adenosine(37)-N6)-threonylcarbamoyltransferase complex dimerization subunit type 1 TsaB [Chitinophagales bacterium]
MALILNIETSSAICSVCLARDGAVMGCKEDHSGTNHAALLAVYIKKLFEEHRMKAADLDAVAVSAGPGSYTGLRIGAATAKGICFAASRPLIAIDSLRILAEGMAERNKSIHSVYCPTIDARRNEIYFSLIHAGGTVIAPPRNLELSETLPFEIRAGEQVVIGGNGREKAMKSWVHKSIIADAETITSSRLMVRLAEEKFTAAVFENTTAFEPAYIKPVYFTKPAKG